jgi:hypothetical protein
MGQCKAGYVMRAVFCLCALMGAPALAEVPLSEVSGNWAGESNAGFYFRATLTQEGDAARLRIWHDINAIPLEGNPQLDNREIALGAFATLQRLDVIDEGNGVGLIVVTEFADETGEGCEELHIRYMDNQFTVTAFAIMSVQYNAGAEQTIFTCQVDMLQDRAIVDGEARDLPPMDFEQKNASLWTYGAAFDWGLCTG